MSTTKAQLKNVAPVQGTNSEPDAEGSSVAPLLHKTPCCALPVNHKVIDDRRNSGDALNLHFIGKNYVTWIDEAKTISSEPFNYWVLFLQKGQRIDLFDEETQKGIEVDLNFVNRFGSLQ